MNVKQRRRSHDGNFVNDDTEEKMHKDICGPIEMKTYGENKYFLTTTLTTHGLTKVHLLSSRDEAPQHCRNFIAWLDRVMDKRIQPVHTDNIERHR